MTTNFRSKSRQNVPHVKTVYRKYRPMIAAHLKKINLSQEAVSGNRQTTNFHPSNAVVCAIACASVCLCFAKTLGNCHILFSGRGPRDSRRHDDPVRERVRGLRSARSPSHSDVQSLVARGFWQSCTLIITQAKTDIPTDRPRVKSIREPK